MFHFYLLANWQTQQRYLVRVAHSNPCKETWGIWLTLKKHKSSHKTGDRKYIWRRAKANHTYFFVTTTKAPEIQTPWATHSEDIRLPGI